MSVVKELESLLHDQPVNPIRTKQVEALQEEQSELNRMINAPAWQAGVNRGAASRRLRAITKTLNEQSPKPLDPIRKDKVHNLANQLLGEIKGQMLPQSTMRRNPPGAVDNFRRGEGSPDTKSKILVWKRGMRALDPDNADTDYTNLEKYRNEGVNPDGTSTFMADAQIPGKFAMTPLAKENWPLGEPTVDTAVKQVAKRELSEKQKAHIAKMTAARQAKRQSAQAQG